MVSEERSFLVRLARLVGSNSFGKEKKGPKRTRE